MDEPGSSVLFSQLILIIILIGISAFFEAALKGFDSLNRTELEQNAKAGRKDSIKILKLLENSDNYKITINTVVVLVNMFAVVFSISGFYNSLLRLLNNFFLAKELAILVIVLILTFFLLLFGKLYPDQIATNSPQKTVKITMPVVKIVAIVLKPFLILLNICAKLLAKITPINNSNQQSEISKIEVLSLIKKSKSAGNIDDEEFEMLEGIINFSEKMVREVMVPRTDTFMVDINGDSNKNIDKILNQPFSRIPVYGGDKDRVVGVIHIKDVLKAARNVGFSKISIPEIMGEPIFVSETTNVNDLLFKMKKTHQQMSIILDEYGGVVGIATIEDLLEEIVGEIDDEYDQSTTLYQRISNNEYKVEGKLNLDDFNRIFEEELELDDVDTIAGYLISMVGEIPKANQELTYELPSGTKLVSGSVKNARIQDITVHLTAKKAKLIIQKLTKKRTN